MHTNENYSISNIDNTTFLVTYMDGLKPYLLFAVPKGNHSYVITIASIDAEDPFSPGYVTFKREVYSFTLYTKFPIEATLHQVLNAFSYPDFDIEYPEALIVIFGGQVNNTKPHWSMHGTFH